MTQPLHRGTYPAEWPAIAAAIKTECNATCIRCGHVHNVESGHVFTVHHFDGNKSNCEWWNLLGLCQRCHLSVQARVNPDQPYIFEHSDWLKPYVAGFYAHKYLGQFVTREEVAARLPELLALERLA
jgi:5-methylcytosine-specific restriction endonuclease McrA